MWISQWKYDRLIERLENLERQSNMDQSYMPQGIGMGRLIRLLMEHMGVYYEQRPAKDELLRKGGPERG